jgi:BirA family transcriptional regulator, biotin operon repressor / biotin---[acetyl-CoA-carboxylase] ligase
MEKRNPLASLNIEELQQQLKTQIFGAGDKLLYFPTIDSTNIRGMQLALGGSEEGTVLLADTQTAGKGRLGRRWFDTPGNNILVSFVLHPLFAPHHLVKLASLAVVDAIYKTCGVSATIKWPNDTLIGTRKVSGVLVETSRTSAGQLVAILGIGVNVNGQMRTWSEDLQDQASLIAAATTLETECGRPISRETLLSHLLLHVETDYYALQEEAKAAPKQISTLIHERWRRQLSTLGRTVEVRQGDTIVEGIAEDINTSGELLLRRRSGELVTVTWGDVGYPTE